MVAARTTSMLRFFMWASFEHLQRVRNCTKRRRALQVEHISLYDSVLEYMPFKWSEWVFLS